MHRTEMTDYATTHDEFVWDLPDTFNFGGDVVDRYAEDPSRLALIWCNSAGAERKFTFADISRLSNRFANLLATHGVGKGDRVVVMLPRVPEWQIALVGCLKAGAVPIPCITMLTDRDVAYRVEHSGAVAAVTLQTEISKFATGAPFRLRLSVGGSSDGWLDFDAALDTESDAFNPVPMAQDDPAIIYYTSGSTGHPKGVTHAARGLFAWRVSAWYWLGLSEDDMMWCTADTGWSKSGTSILFGPWSCGSAVLFYDGGFDPKERLRLIGKYGVTVFCAAATEFRRLILEDLSPYDLSKLRHVVSAGETVNPEVVDRWQALTGISLYDGYGLTEILMVVLNYPCMPVKPGSMGRPLPGTDALVIGDDDRPVGPGVPGRLVIKLPNPQLMLEYWRDPERTAACFITINGTRYLLTGDMVVQDQDGYLFYHGRSDDVINASGYRIGPLEVENALIEHPAVQECAAVASPDPDRGEVVKAFVVLKDGYIGDAALTQALQDHVKHVTAPYKYPRKVEFVADLPKTPTGKIRRRELRDREFGVGDS